MSKKAYITYCTGKKNPMKYLLPAIERYQSVRINDVYSKALKDNVHFFILSGKFGLLHCWDPIPYYDYRLVQNDVLEHSKLVTQQLLYLKVDEVVFFTISPIVHKEVKPYSNCIKTACASAKVKIEIKDYKK